jgi:hypothetical protein
MNVLLLRARCWLGTAPSQIQVEHTTLKRLILYRMYYAAVRFNSPDYQLLYVQFCASPCTDYLRVAVVALRRDTRTTYS